MKRLGNIFEKIISLENLWLADERARKGKRNSYGVRVHDKNRLKNLKKLHEDLKNGNFQTSEYYIYQITEPKERTIYRLPYFPDRIVHHAIMNVLESMFVANFTADTYSCIKGRGIHLMAKKIKKALRNDMEGTKYCLKFDIKKFYPTVKHGIMQDLLERKIKDKKLLPLLFEVVESAPGLPIGNYLSQYFANFYLSYFDHWLKEVKREKYVFRYADDVAILSDDKEHLHKLFREIRQYLHEELSLEIKGNWQVFPVEARSLDMGGYRFWRTHTMLRKSIKKSFARAVKRKASKQTIDSYKGWAKHCDAKNLLKQLEVV